jgi:hypothetical protein
MQGTSNEIVTYFWRPDTMETRIQPRRISYVMIMMMNMTVARYMAKVLGFRLPIIIPIGQNRLKMWQNSNTWDNTNKSE